MSVIKENAIIRVASDTAGNWTSNNPTPAAGEWCKETDTGYLKNGDGSTAWTSLAYTFGATSATVSTYSTAWINRSDWTNVHMGTDDTKNADSNLTHSLSAPLSDLLVKVFISTDGTDANSFEVGTVDSRVAATATYGFNISQVDSDNILIQTGADGIPFLTTAGAFSAVDTDDWYYKIKVYKLA